MCCARPPASAGEGNDHPASRARHAADRGDDSDPDTDEGGGGGGGGELAGQGASSEPQDPEDGDHEEEASSQDFLIEEPDSQESFSSMDVDGAGEASSQDTLSGLPDSQGSFSSMDLDEEGEAESGPAPDEAGETKEGDGQSRGAGGPESGGAGGGGPSPNLALGRVKVVGQGGRTPAGHLRVDLSRAGRHPELATPFTTGRARERTCFDRRGHHGGCACATEALRAAYAMWGEGRGDAASARAAATRHGVDRATPAREMRSSEGRVLETADAFLDDKADRLWRTRSAALRELAQKVIDGTDLVLLCAGRIESCHGDLLKKGILAEAAQLEARGPRADSVETAARMGVLSTFYLRHVYGRDSPGLHEEDGVLSANGGVLCAGCGEEAPGLGARDGEGDGGEGGGVGEGGEVADSNWR